METKNTTQQTTSKLQNPTLAWSLLALLAVIWGSSFILVKKSLVIFDASQVGSLRIGAAFLFFLPFVLINLKKIPFQKAHIFLLVGCLGNLFPAYLFSLAGSKLDSGVSGALNSTTPLFTLIVGGLFFGNKITSKQTIGIVLGFIGALLLILAGATGFNFKILDRLRPNSISNYFLHIYDHRTNSFNCPIQWRFLAESTKPRSHRSTFIWCSFRRNGVSYCHGFIQQTDTNDQCCIGKFCDVSHSNCSNYLGNYRRRNYTNSALFRYGNNFSWCIFGE
jgi:uncharacterized membrane protein